MTYYRPFLPPLLDMRPETFEKWFPYAVKVKDEKKDAAFEWVSNTIVSDWTNNWVQSKYLTATVRPQQHTFYFSNKNDALICKLKWG